MHIRFTQCMGFPVTEEGSDATFGTISGILIVPDTGKIEGFFVHSHGLLGGENLYCSSADIVRWGTRVYVRSSDVLAPPDDRIRIQDLLADSRTVLGQKIQTESGFTVGTCKDVQFNTKTMHVEWLFPRKWFRFGVALPISDVLEVTAAKIIVRDPVKKESVSQQESVSAKLPDVEPATA